MSKTEAADAVARFRKRNRHFWWAATLALAAIGTVLGLTLLVVLTKGHTMRTTTLQQLPLVWLPALFYLWALWSARQMFDALSRGGFVFHTVVSNALGRIGWALALGAAATIVIVPMMLSMGAHVVGGFALFNVPALTIGVVGLALIVTGRMMRHAAALEARVASLNAVLADFI